MGRSRPQKEGQEGGQGQAGGALQARQEQVVLQQAPLLNDTLSLSFSSPSACLCPVIVTLALWRYMWFEILSSFFDHVFSLGPFFQHAGTSLTIVKKKCCIRRDFQRKKKC